ncbi:MAG: hypothetical protein VX498_01395 [Myxococcota bacterium]|nr:hypothetical protein [Myxococcota bacterium]
MGVQPPAWLNRCRPYLLPVGLTVVTAFIVLHRIARTPLVPYGTHGAQHLEHSARLAALWNWRHREGLSWVEWIRNIDGDYPPLLHLLTSIPGAVTGHAAESVVWTGLLWLLALAGLVAWTTKMVSGRRDAAWAAFVGTLLVPALPAVATRYYYDLPLAVLAWAAAALVLLTWDRRMLHALLGGLAVGLIITAAALVKWTGAIAVPFVVIAAFATPRCIGSERRWRLRPRLLALVTAVAIAALCSYAVICLLGEDSSLRRSMDRMWPGVGTAFLEGGTPHFTEAFNALLSGRGSGSGSRESASFFFYPITLVTAVLSPLLALVCLPLFLRWFRRGRVGWQLIGISGLTTWAFLHFFVGPHDERFLLSIVPAVVIAATLGWASFEGPARRVLASAVILAGLSVSIDYPYGPVRGFSVPIPLPAPKEYGVLQARGLGLADSYERRGWSRFDSDNPNNQLRQAARDRLWTLVSACGFESEALRDAPAGAAPFGELYWLEYQFQLNNIGEATPTDVPEDCSQATALLAGIDRAERVDRNLLLAAGIKYLLQSDGGWPVRISGCREELLSFLASRGHQPTPDSETGDSRSPLLLDAMSLLLVEQAGPDCARIRH